MEQQQHIKTERVGLSETFLEARRSKVQKKKQERAHTRRWLLGHRNSHTSREPTVVYIL